MGATRDGAKGDTVANRKDEVVDPVKIEGSCLFCPCGSRVEMEAAVLASTTPEVVRCGECIKRIRVPPRGSR